MNDYRSCCFVCDYCILFLLSKVMFQKTSQRESVNIYLIDLLTLDRPFFFIYAALADGSSNNKFGFQLVEGDIYRTRRQSLYYRIQLGKPSLDSTKYEGDPRQAYCVYSQGSINDLCILHQ